jgi:hypothetical protein
VRSKRRAAAKALAIARAKAAARAAAQARADAAAAARAAAAANAWHAGLSYSDETDNGTVYWRWRNDLGCVDYALSGCARIELAAENGCSSLFVQSNESATESGPIIGDAIDSQDNVPPEKRVLMELDASQDSTRYYSAPTITCYP